MLGGEEPGVREVLGGEELGVREVLGGSRGAGVGRCWVERSWG